MNLNEISKIEIAFSPPGRGRGGFEIKIIQIYPPQPLQGGDFLYHLSFIQSI
jgi:hypothetical protein